MKLIFKFNDATIRIDHVVVVGLSVSPPQIVVEFTNGQQLRVDYRDVDEARADLARITEAMELAAQPAYTPWMGS